MLSSFNNLWPSRLSWLKRELLNKHSGTRSKARRRHTPSFPTSMVPTIRGRCYQAAMPTTTREAKTKSSWSHQAPQTSSRLCDGSRQGHHSSPQSLENPSFLGQPRTMWNKKGSKLVKILEKGPFWRGVVKIWSQLDTCFKVTGQSVDNMVHVFCSRYDFQH